MMDNLLPWFALKSVPGLGNHTFKRIIDQFGSPRQAIESPLSSLKAIPGITHEMALAIQDTRLDDRVKKDMELVHAENVKIVTLLHSEYPRLLLQMPDPPPLLYIWGSIDNRQNNLAIVGSRRATGYGITTAHKLSRALVQKNLRIVSGMARGIDSAAHRGAIEGGGKTFAILGSGLLVIYPPENKNLFHEIIENGAVISEFPMATPPEGRNFPLRNRIICGMSLGTMVVEAAGRSGSLITARLAAEQGREVFAVPGSINSPVSRGTHSLLKQGAKLVENADDVMEEIYPQMENRTIFQESAPKSSLPAMNEEETNIFNALEPYPIQIDQISRKALMEPGKVSAVLLNLELKGIVTQSPGKLFSIKEE